MQARKAKYVARSIYQTEQANHLADCMLDRQDIVLVRSHADALIRHFGLKAGEGGRVAFLHMLSKVLSVSPYSSQTLNLHAHHYEGLALPHLQ